MELLRKDKGPSFGHMVAYYGSDEVWSCSVLVFPDAVKNGDTAFELAVRLHVKNWHPGVWSWKSNNGESHTKKSGSTAKKERIRT